MSKKSNEKSRKGKVKFMVFVCFMFKLCNINICQGDGFDGTATFKNDVIEVKENGGR